MKMMSRILLIVIQVVLYNLVYISGHLDWETNRPAFDPVIYEDALDPEICSQQLEYIRNDLLRLTFLESGMRLPRGILQYNTLDMGNYDQCIGIHQDIKTSVIEGKYCMIRGPVDRNFVEVAESMNWSDFHSEMLSEENLRKYKEIEDIQTKMKAIQTGVSRISQRTSALDLSGVPTVQMALCIPKTCTTQEGMRGLLFNLTRLGFRYEDQFCRFKNDKPWVPVDYVAIILLSVIGVLTILSTTYDVWHVFVAKRDPKEAVTLYRSFSIYNNSKRLTTFSSNPNTLSCVDGIRAISMFWIVVGHCYSLVPPMYNVLSVLSWIMGLESLWITAAPFTVDTFFFLSGMLVVYTTVGKLKGINLLKNLHLFYLNRIMRMFPLLALIVLLQASVFHKIADGPFWIWNAANTDACRTYWWTTLLYVQNFLNPTDLCIGQSWYLAIDMHCYLLCPLVLFWLLNGKNKQAWIALTCGLLVSLSVATTYSFIMKFQGWIIGQVREGGEPDYLTKYYFNTVPRTPPFFVGMCFGYILSIWKGRRPRIPYYLVAFLWISVSTAMLLLMYVTHEMKETTWKYWTLDDLMNSFARPLWALALGWIIFACQYGYGGPVNWFLSLDIWKLPSRISYAMYLFHYQIQFIQSGTTRQPIYFSDSFALNRFLSQVTISFGISFAVTVLFEAPFSVLTKMILDPKKPPQKKLAIKNRSRYD